MGFDGSRSKLPKGFKGHAPEGAVNVKEFDRESKPRGFAHE